MTSARSPAVPPWARLYVPGEPLEDWRERRCASPRCGAVLCRKKGMPAEWWENRRYCCAACFNGEPPIPKKEP